MSAARRGSLRRGVALSRRPRHARRPLPPSRARWPVSRAGRAAPSARLPSAQYVVAHELRTPLTSLVVGSRILLGDSVNKARRREVARDVAAEAQRLSDAVEDLLVLAGLESSAGEAEPVSLQATVRAEIDRAGRLMPDLSVRTLLPPDVAPVVADARAVGHLVRNLVAAAVDAAGERGLVEVALVGDPAGRVRLRAAGRPGRRAAAAGRPAAPLRDVAGRVLAERLGGSLAGTSGPAGSRFELVLPAGGDEPDDGALASGGDGPTSGDGAPTPGDGALAPGDLRGRGGLGRGR
jgi:hypothetical protein